MNTIKSRQSRIFKTRYFSRWMEKTELSDALLISAVAEMERGLCDADLGGGVFKNESRYPIAVKAAVSEPLLRQKKIIVGFLCWDLRKINATISTTAN